jgi:hypothetical protein
VSKKAEQRKQALIDQHSAEIRDLKGQIDARRRDETALRAEMDRFMAQYETFVRELDGQRRELESQIRRCRYRIEHFYDEDKVDEETHDETPLPDVEPDEPPLPPTPGPDPGQLIREAKQNIRRYFADFWHPDRDREAAHADEGLMAQVNVAFDASQDVADMLAAIPWHEDWLVRPKNETLIAQLGRLIEWAAHLSTADERLTRRLERMRQDWRYPLCQEWKAAPDKRAYFTALSGRERKEIQRLEGTLSTLQEKLKRMQEQAPEAGS